MFLVPLRVQSNVRVVSRFLSFSLKRFEHFVYSAQCSASYSGWLQHFKRGLTAGVTMTLLR